MVKEIINNLINDLEPRQRDVIVSRFGLKGERRTLASIGGKYHLTRERIRQIEEAALKLIRKKINKKHPAVNFFETIAGRLKKLGGVRKDEDLINDSKALFKDTDISHSQLKFIFRIFGRPKLYLNDADFYNFWYLDEEDFKKANDFINRFSKILENRKKEILSKKKKFDDFFNSFKMLSRNIDPSSGMLLRNISAAPKASNLPKNIALNYLSVSKKFKTNPFNQFGFSHWEEINPSTVLNKTHLILKRHGRPLHFKEITEKINEAKFDNRLALPQTVHNELIRDPRFVLVGRGTYGLLELGFKPGSAQEVIAGILKAKGPLNREKIVKLALQERFIKPATVLLNLHSRKHFKRLPDGRYHLA